MGGMAPAPDGGLQTTHLKNMVYTTTEGDICSPPRSVQGIS